MSYVAIIHEAPVPTWSSRQLILALERKGLRTAYLRPSRMSLEINGETVKLYYGLKVIEKPEAMLIRSFGFTVSTEQFFARLKILAILSSENVFTINPIPSIINARDKFHSLYILSKNGIPVPETLLTENVFLATEKTKEWGDVVIKPLMGSLGYGSVRTSEPDIAFHIGKVLASINQPLYVQKYVKKPQRDIRVLVVGEEVLGAVYRISKESWKTNVAQGARVVKAPKIPEVEELALKATKALGLMYSGVDIGETPDGKYVVFEVNASPLWKGFQQATGINPADKIAELVKANIRK